MPKAVAQEEVEVIDGLGLVLDRVAAEMNLRIEGINIIDLFKTEKCGHLLNGGICMHYCQAKRAVAIAWVDYNKNDEITGFSVAAADKPKIVDFARKVAAKLKTKLTVTVVDSQEFEGYRSENCPNESHHGFYY